MFRTVVLTHIYREKLSHNETLALLHSFSILQRHDIFFVGPSGLDISFYQQTFPLLKYVFFNDDYFSSTDSYSKLLLSIEFYKAFPGYTHMLIVQTDCIVFSDDLDYWMASPYDYVGAPWAKAWEYLFPNLGTPLDGLTFFVTVGNGGLSLRRITAVLRVLDELAWLADRYQKIVEDVFFSLAGQISTNFIIPNIIHAAQFSIECEPRRHYGMAGRLPMGVHAWEKWDKEFWLENFEKAGLIGFE